MTSNWAWGTVKTTGTMDAVLAFSKRFIADDDNKKELQTVRCKNCGYTESIASFDVLEDMECSECGSCDFEHIEEGS